MQRCSHGISRVRNAPGSAAMPLAGGAPPGASELFSLPILQCLERLNDKATQRAAGEDLAALVRVRGCPWEAWHPTRG